MAVTAAKVEVVVVVEAAVAVEEPVPAAVEALVSSFLECCMLQN